MDINQLDIEINTKAKETLKNILKKPNVEIMFDLSDENENVSEMTSIVEGDHEFLLVKITNITQLININPSYYNLFSTKLKIKLKKLTMEQRTKLISLKTWYLIFLIPFFGKRFCVNSENIDTYKLTYNDVVIDLTKLEYDRFLYYTHYVYKLQQLHKLNQELNIQQEFSIVFDDDKSAMDLYRSMYNNFEGLIIPPNKDTDYLNDEEDC